MPGSYGSVMTMMDQLHEAQIENAGLITDTRKKPGDAAAGNRWRTHIITSAPTRSSRPRCRTRADMNVTPLIDVLLVLLVIFMAARR
jgi:biopolymer transport protein ExbD